MPPTSDLKSKPRNKKLAFLAYSLTQKMETVHVGKLLAEYMSRRQYCHDLEA
jgi:hypothetical protein